MHQEAVNIIQAVHAGDGNIPECPSDEEVLLREPLVDAGISPSVGSVGDSYDNSLAETIIGLYKAEVICRGPWQAIDDVEFAMLK